jgi:XXXCH domain-containing protein
MAPKIKNSWHLTRAEAADLLHKLAETIEEGTDEVPGYGLSLAELVKFKLKIELDATDSLEVKFSGKGAKISGPDVRGESYSSLKKRMQIYFKALRDSVAKAELPSREIVAVFLADSEKMVSFDGYGDEFYPTYAALCDRLRTACDSEDMSELATVVMALDQAKKSCHERYK